MKKLTLALVAALSLSTAVFAEESVAGSTGQIKFIGTVTEAGCTIVTNNPNAIIDLGTITKTQLSAEGASAAWGTGQIKFEGCLLADSDDTLSSVELTVSKGNPMEGKSEYWANDGSANNVGIEVEIQGTKVPPSGVTEAIKATIDKTTATAVYPVRGRMVGVGQVTAGSVNQTVIFTANYK